MGAVRERARPDSRVLYQCHSKSHYGGPNPGPIPLGSRHNAGPRHPGRDLWFGPAQQSRRGSRHIEPGRRLNVSSVSLARRLVPMQNLPLEAPYRRAHQRGRGHCRLGRFSGSALHAALWSTTVITDLGTVDSDPCSAAMASIQEVRSWAILIAPYFYTLSSGRMADRST